MASSRTLSDGAPLRTTKQMLDELDALMARMLTLPVNDLEDAPPPLAASLTVLDAPLPAAVPEEPVAVPVNVGGSMPTAEGATPRYTTPGPVGEAILPRQLHWQDRITPITELASAPVEERRPEPLPEAITNRLPPPTLIPAVELLLESVPAHTPPATFWCLLPLVWLNQAFDAVVISLGGLGRGLCTGVGRALMGAAGLALLTLAVCWGVAEWHGWPW